MSELDAASSQLEGTPHRSRRDLLVGTAAGVSVIATGVLMKAAPASADNGNALLLGVSDNTATSPTGLIGNTVDLEVAFSADNANGSIGLSGSAGNVGVYGRGPEGVYGDASNGSGSALGGTVNGVHGVCDVSGNAVWGESVDRGLGAGNGVYGSTTSSGASGVYGHNAGTGYGVAGRAESGTGTLGDSTNGVGVAASSQNGTALDVTGRAVFNRSGLVTITAPAKSASVAVPGGLATTALVLALLQNAVPGVSVASAVPNKLTGKVTINLNKTPPSTSPAAKVAWFVLG
jgi:hypothetical protein